ncbi:hypothetical protein PIB30_094437 [Stylosanthes scabra]|uniref:Uncharacterized protein n=1 Tax=Stylosanthes scabra TaxID=79078 RepID=A0ABU6XX58_9FABA|nr:hypothetical protein [Stylosanthes scabra]
MAFRISERIREHQLTIPVGGITPTSVWEITPIPFTSTSSKATESFEEAFTKLTLNTNTFIEETRSIFKNQGEGLKKVEVQVGDLAKQLQQLQHKIPNAFLGNTIVNPNAECKAVNVVMVEEALTQEEKVEAEINPLLQSRNHQVRKRSLSQSSEKFSHA